MRRLAVILLTLSSLTPFRAESAESCVQDRLKTFLEINLVSRFALQRPLTVFQAMVIRQANRAGEMTLFLANLNSEKPLTHSEFLAQWREQQTQILADGGFTTAEIDALISSNVVHGPGLTWGFENFDNIRRNLLAVPYLDAKTARVQNALALKNLAVAPAIPETGRLSEFDLETLAHIYKAVATDPVMESDHAKKVYDRGRNIGFCFGRALGVHLEALTRGLSNHAIRKVWAVGHLQSDDTRWAYHVTTAIKGPLGRWYAVDPYFEAPLEIAEWSQKMQEINPDGKMQIFVTDPSRFFPDEDSKYNRTRLEHATYYGFFTDYLKAFRAKMKLKKATRKKPGWTSVEDKL